MAVSELEKEAEEFKAARLSVFDDALVDVANKLREFLYDNIVDGDWKHIAIQKVLEGIVLARHAAMIHGVADYVPPEK